MVFTAIMKVIQVMNNKQQITGLNEHLNAPKRYTYSLSQNIEITLIDKRLRVLSLTYITFLYAVAYVRLRTMMSGIFNASMFSR